MGNSLVANLRKILFQRMLVLVLIWNWKHPGAV